MYSLTICFGPTGTTWAFLFKDKENAEKATAVLRAPCPDDCNPHNVRRMIEDEFGQSGEFLLSDIHGSTLEDLEQVEAARIYRSLAEERLKVKLMEAARADPTIRAAMNQQRPPVLTPMGGGFRT